MTLPPDIRYVRHNLNTGQWEGAPSNYGPWGPIPAPQSDTPFPTMPTPQPSAPWLEPAPMPQRTLSDRLALAICTSDSTHPLPCDKLCQYCRDESAAVAKELAAWLREQLVCQVADLLDGVGCHKRT